MTEPAIRAKWLLPVNAGELLDHTPEIRDLADRLRQDLFAGERFAVLRFTPVPDTVEHAELLLLSVGALVGDVLAQDRKGNVIDRVTDLGTGTARGSKTNRDLPYHTDFAAVVPDVFILLAVHRADSGGHSRLVAAGAAREALAAKSPAAADTLARDFYFLSIGDTPGEEPSVFRAPVFSRRVSRAGDRDVVFYNRARIHRGHRLVGRPLTPAQIRALDLLDEWLATSGDPHTLMLTPGDALMINNWALLHGRAAFSDADTPEPRLLLRLWLRCAAAAEWRVTPTVLRPTSTGGWQ